MRVVRKWPKLDIELMLMNKQGLLANVRLAQLCAVSNPSSDPCYPLVHPLQDLQRGGRH